MGISDADIGELLALMGQVVDGRFDPLDFGALYEWLRAQTTLSMVDEMVGAVSRSALPRAGVGELGRRLAASGRAFGLVG
jgi:hypothetical protein